MKLKKILLVTLTLLAPTTAAYASTLSFVCSYPEHATLNENGSAVIDNGDFSLTFLIDEDTNKAYTIGNLGSDEIMFLPSNEGYNFIEVTATGNVMLTTVTTDLMSVHSRHTAFSSLPKLIPSQYYGTCKIKN